MVCQHKSKLPTRQPGAKKKCNCQPSHGPQSQQTHWSSCVWDGSEHPHQFQSGIGHVSLPPPYFNNYKGNKKLTTADLPRTDGRPPHKTSSTFNSNSKRTFGTPEARYQLNEEWSPGNSECTSTSRRHESSRGNVYSNQQRSVFLQLSQTLEKVQFAVIW